MLKKLPISPAAPPGGLAESSKASWRELVPEIICQSCDEYAVCTLYCPEGALVFSGKTLTVNLKHCKGCGICANECPEGIRMVPEYPEGRGVYA